LFISRVPTLFMNERLVGHEIFSANGGGPPVIETEFLCRSKLTI
jgi:hypothetical protein